MNRKGFEPFLLRKQLHQVSKLAVAPQNQKSFEKELTHRSIPHAVVISNLTDYLMPKKTFLRKSFKKKGEINFKEYFRYKEINDYLDGLAKRYQTVVKVKTAGKSSEGRVIKAVHISHGRSHKRVLVITAGIHAREWASPALALYIIHKLVEKSRKTEKFLLNFEWIILPLTNPDGYEYTHTTNRMWRKTRSKQKGNCYGVDANRNFEFYWGGSGSSGDPCAETFRGKEPFSEPESRAIASVLMSVKRRCLFYIDLHTYGGYILMPWAYKK